MCECAYVCACVGASVGRYQFLLPVYGITNSKRYLVFYGIWTSKIALGKILVGEKSANRELFAKIFLTNIHRYTENVFGICTDCSLFTKFFLTNSFTCTVHQNFPPLNISHVWYLAMCCWCTRMSFVHLVHSKCHIPSAWNSGRTSDTFQPKLLTVWTVLVLVRHNVQANWIIYDFRSVLGVPFAMISNHLCITEQDVIVWTNYVNVWSKSILFRHYAFAYFLAYFRHCHSLNFSHQWKCFGWFIV